MICGGHLDDQVRLTSNSTEEQATGRSRDLDTWLRWDWTPTATVKSHTSIALANTERNSSGSLNLPGLADGSLYAERSFSTRSLRSEWTYVPSSALRWDFGGDLGRESAELTFFRHEIFGEPIALGFGRPLDASISSNQAPRSSTLGLYTSGRGRWREEFEAEVGLRLDGQTYQGFGTRSQLSPRINLRYDMTDTWHAYASWGQFTQAQRVDEYRSEANQTTPDPASRAVHLLAGIAHESAAALYWRLEMYRYHWSAISPYFDNLLGSVSLTPELEPDRVLITPTDAEAAGVELSAQRSFNHGLNAWGIYSLSRVTDDISGQDIPRSWDQRHAANVGLAWTHQGSAVSALLGWHSGWPTTPLTLVSASSSTPVYFAAGMRNSVRWGSYLSADLRFSTSVRLRYGELSLWVDATNITSRSNDCCADLNPIGGATNPPAIVDERLPPASTARTLSDSANPNAGLLNLARQHARMMAGAAAKTVAVQAASRQRRN